MIEYGDDVMRITWPVWVAIFLGIFVVIAGMSLEKIAQEEYEKSGITYQEGHPTTSGGVEGWSPLKSLKIIGRIAYRYIKENL